MRTYPRRRVRQVAKARERMRSTVRKKCVAHDRAPPSFQTAGRDRLFFSFFFSLLCAGKKTRVQKEME